MNYSSSPLWIFIAATLLSGLAGITRQLMVSSSRRRKRFGEVVVGGIYASVVGLGSSLVYYDTYGSEKPYLLLGVCVFIGLSGAIGTLGVLNALLAVSELLQKVLEAWPRDKDQRRGP